ncbi:MAG: deoxyribodipyrimidine photo-lyase [Hyphomicrobiaceae bacterium]
MTIIVWFRQDLRLTDNPALSYAASRGAVLPVYILDETPPPAGRPMGGASRWWLHHSLDKLSRSLGGLVLRRGAPADILPKLAKHVGAEAVVWNRCYEPYAIVRDKALKADLSARGLDVASFNGSLLFEPWEVETGAGLPYKVYSPFWRACQRLAISAPESAPRRIELAKTHGLGEGLDDWGLSPKNPDWAKGFGKAWTPGEAGAQARLVAFLKHGLAGYAGLRNHPDQPNVSRLSPHLHWGEISPRQIWASVRACMSGTSELDRDGNKFLSELGWREFNHHLIYHFPTMHERNWKRAFDSYPWRSDKTQLRAWQRGRTGYPIVDAGMRELWATGYMHNRVRMIVASFLVKHLRIDWRQGEAWFWDTLVDADLANNVAGWQWTAGSGADAAPYFRIFNPIEQGRKFDSEGNYTRRWCPELKRLPNQLLHAPFEATPETLEGYGVKLGATYPHPIVDHMMARRAALEGYDQVKNADQAGS